ncbi:BatD family protein [Thiospirochaeta perfilievii]|nr:BatD family protein [Thiospirochaeta perfilievii]
MKKNIIILIFLTINGFLFSQTIDIELQDSYVNLGEWTTFRVTVSGNITNLKYSEPKDLTITQIGKSSSVNLVLNGSKSSSLILTYRVKPQKAGTLKLPIFYSENSNGESIKSDQLVLYVEELKDDIITKHDTTKEFETQYVKLFIDIPDRNLYVGEAIPVEIVAYFSTSYQPGIDRSPYIKTGSFVVDTGQKYFNDRPEKVINGERWLQVYWKSHLTPLKAGKLDLEIVMDSYIDKPTSNGGFFSSSERQEIKTTTEIKTLNIKMLPINDRPDSFSGAIGDFSLNDSINLTDISVGDPVTLTMDIFGEGNFQRINVPKISSESESWKLYPESSSYRGTNKSNYQGVKSFEQILAPTTDKVTTTPKFTFSYFNPIEEKYYIISSTEFPISVSPSQFINKEVVDESNNSFNEKKEEIRHKVEKKVDFNRTIFENPLLYVALTSTLLTLITILVISILSKRQSSDVSTLKRDQKNLLLKIKLLENSKNYLEALNLYKNLIQITVSDRLKCEPQAITHLDIEDGKIKDIMVKLDEFKYTSRSIDFETYKALADGIKKELKC